MANLTKLATASVDINTAKLLPPVSGVFAGEAIDLLAPCHINVDGTVHMSASTGTVGAIGEYVGFAPAAYALGEAVTLFGKGLRFSYGAALVEGKLLYISATPGALSDAVVISSDVSPIARVITPTDILVIR
ncbi:hypothetical protein LCGC14_0607760 [marine sediment metagenome]|uniref:Uncharacterized protein n=1 Tax=marine sediment metagenome TaxID=412755 RepID=A0A0F9RDF2_9ZZZZ